MTTARIKANRANAKASTGPKTAGGKARAAQNSRRHGLSLSILADPVLSADVKNLAREIAGERTNPEILELAHRVAEAQIDFVRIRQARHGLLAHELDERNLRPEIVEVVNVGPAASTRLVFILDHLPNLIAMDRYERRALSRRKFAIRELDAARRVSDLA